MNKPSVAPTVTFPLRDSRKKRLRHQKNASKCSTWNRTPVCRPKTAHVTFQTAVLLRLRQHLSVRPNSPSLKTSVVDNKNLIGHLVKKRFEVSIIRSVIINGARKIQLVCLGLGRRTTHYDSLNSKRKWVSLQIGRTKKKQALLPRHQLNEVQNKK